MYQTIEQQQTAFFKAKDSLAHKQALINALGDPSEYEYTGIVTDTGAGSNATCACGHPIRYQFWILNSKTQRKATIGSTCINHFAQINPALCERLTQALTELEEQLKAEKRKAKEAENQAKVQVAKDAYQAVYDRAYRIHKHNMEMGRKSPFGLWWIIASCKGALPRSLSNTAYKTARGYINWYTQATKEIEAVLTD